MRKLLILLFLSCCSAGPERCAALGVKTNALHWATAGTLNAGLEAGLGKRTSLELTGDYNPWTLDRGREPETQILVGDAGVPLLALRTLQRPFFRLHSGYGEYNISGVRIPFLKKSVKDHRYQGWATGLGISYGYRGCWAGAGIWRRPSVRDTSIRITTATNVRPAANSADGRPALFRTDESRHFHHIHHRLEGRRDEAYLLHIVELCWHTARSGRMPEKPERR